MADLGIERGLRQSSRKPSPPFFKRYDILKERLLEIDYPYWSRRFPGGNDHGPGHILRVLEKLDLILGKNPVQSKRVTVYELFLAMMSVLYHDIGLLRERKGHARFSKLILEEENNSYIVNELDKEIISAAVVSHTSRKSIEAECQRFSEVERIGGHTVRPRVIAALVRLADELDEDYRRADPDLERRLNLSEESKFYWQFCQRILAIEPHQPTKQILVNVRFEAKDIARAVKVDGNVRSFVAAFAEKLAKINRERIVSNKFLPPELQYHHIRVVARPLASHKEWKEPREFVFSDNTSAKEFIERFPELLKDPVAKMLAKSIELIRGHELDKADTQLQRLEDISKDLSADNRLMIYYDRACLESLRAEEFSKGSLRRREALRQSLQHLSKWLIEGDKGAWREAGRDPWNEIHRMGCEADLWCLHSERRSWIVRKIPKRLRPALPKKLPRRSSDVGGTGCVLAHASIDTPQSSTPILNIRAGDQILSTHPGDMDAPIAVKVKSVHTSRAHRCICINRRFVVTPTQPLYERELGWVAAANLAPGMCILNLDQKHYDIRHIEEKQGYFEVYSLTTDHGTQNYVADRILCHNKYVIM